jgi:hypothetical protein
VCSFNSFSLYKKQSKKKDNPKKTQQKTSPMSSTFDLSSLPAPQEEDIDLTSLPAKVRTEPPRALTLFQRFQAMANEQMSMLCAGFFLGLVVSHIPSMFS